MPASESAESHRLVSLDVFRGITILAMRKKTGKLKANPPDEETIEDGDRLLIMGTKKRLAALEETFEGGKAS